LKIKTNLHIFICVNGDPLWATLTHVGVETVSCPGTCFIMPHGFVAVPKFVYRHQSALGFLFIIFSCHLSSGRGRY